MVLRNDDVELISFSTKYPDPRKGSLANFRKTGNNQTRYAGDLFISLEKLSYKNGKSPYRHTKKPEKADLLGTWRTEFYRKGLTLGNIKDILSSSGELQKLLNDLKIEIIGSGEDGRNESMSASGTLTFTFDDKEVSDKFYGAFRQAIKLCN